MRLFALVACTHAFIARAAIVTISAGLHLNAGKGAKILIVAMIIAALNATFNVFVCLFLAHDLHLIKTFCRFRQMYFVLMRIDYADFPCKFQEIGASILPISVETHSRALRS